MKVTIRRCLMAAVLLWGGAYFVPLAYGEDVRKSAAQGEGVSAAAPSGDAEGVVADEGAEELSIAEGTKKSDTMVEMGTETAAEDKGGKDSKEMSKEDLLSDIKAFLADDEVLGAAPTITRVRDASGAEYFTVRLGSDSVKRLDDLDQETLVNVWCSVSQARVSVQTQRISRQIEFTRKNIQNIVEQQRQLQQMVPSRIQQIHQTMVPPYPQQPQTPPRQPQTPAGPPPNPPRQQR